MVPVGKVSTSWENLSQPEERLARCPVAGGQGGVGCHHPVESIGMFGEEAEADQTSPVLADHGHPGQPEMVEEE